MKLSTYIDSRSFTQQEFIDHCYAMTGREFTQGCLSKWILGKRRPRAIECKAIYIATEGLVSPNDFYLDLDWTTYQ